MRRIDAAAATLNGVRSDTKVRRDGLLSTQMLAEGESRTKAVESAIGELGQIDANHVQKEARHVKTLVAKTKKYFSSAMRPTRNLEASARHILKNGLDAMQHRVEKVALQGPLVSLGDSFTDLGYPKWC